MEQEALECCSKASIVTLHSVNRDSSSFRVRMVSPAHLQTMSRGFWCQGLSWYQFKVQHGYFNFSRGSRGLNLQYNITSLVFTGWSFPLWLIGGGTLSAFGELTEISLTTEWSSRQSTPFKRWSPFGPHPMACWVGDTLAVTWCIIYHCEKRTQEIIKSCIEKKSFSVLPRVTH